MTSRMFGFEGLITNFRAAGISRCFGVMYSTALREARNMGICQLWYHAMDIHTVLLYVEFEDGLSISVLKYKSNAFNGPVDHIISNPAFFKLVCALTQRSQSLQDEWNKSKNMELVQTRFYSLNETLAKLHVRVAME
ncbi:hypothetical protein [Absidia glauca]|uniref:Uncharacterized protein n=1 Tax=Absidia glauca TaxID=4829 RepID=A0A170AQ34_ABSGL|nr:hypothetical protein [Absidia glauca]